MHYELWTHGQHPESLARRGFTISINRQAFTICLLPANGFKFIIYKYRGSRQSALVYGGPSEGGELVPLAALFPPSLPQVLPLLPPASLTIAALDLVAAGRCFHQQPLGLPGGVPPILLVTIRCCLLAPASRRAFHAPSAPRTTISMLSALPPMLPPANAAGSTSI